MPKSRYLIRSAMVGASMFFAAACTQINVPHKQPLMAKIPQVIEVPSALHLNSSRVGDWSELSAGRYTLVYENKKGYFYKSAGGKIRHSTVFGPVESLGGLEYSKDFGEFCVFIELSYSKAGELVAYFAKKEQGDTDDILRAPQGWISKEQSSDWKLE